MEVKSIKNEKIIMAMAMTKIIIIITAIMKLIIIMMMMIMRIKSDSPTKL